MLTCKEALIIAKDRADKDGNIALSLQIARILRNVTFATPTDGKKA